MTRSLGAGVGAASGGIGSQAGVGALGAGVGVITPVRGPVFASMYKDEAALSAVTITNQNEWYLIDLSSLVDIDNNRGVVMDSNGEFKNNTGRQLKAVIDNAFTMSSASGNPAYEISLGINNGSGYAVNGDDLYDDGQVFRNSATTTTQKAFRYMQTAIIPVGAKFGLLIRNTSNSINPTFRHWNFIVEEITL